MQRHITLVFMPIHLSPEGLRVLGIFTLKFQIEAASDP